MSGHPEENTVLEVLFHKIGSSNHLDYFNGYVIYILQYWEFEGEQIMQNNVTDLLYCTLYCNTLAHIVGGLLV
ncbi:hypothetical protein XELAEV_18026890mg [Xenopus laevis]|uniref:Uncharacterized protein n=1 Tax=Xenopus laevis TaxID=8355 RepID=A0A974HJS9_XENLA|nr:hypothetical protein XELAEV_18026890mg [Xenopus laevis]